MDRAQIVPEKDFHLLAESLPQIVWICRADGEATFFNQKWVEYTGLSLEESYGPHWIKPVHPDDQPRAWEAWCKAVHHQQGYSLEVQLRRADGAYRWWLVRGEPTFNEDGTLDRWFGTTTDIHDIKLAELRLREGAEKLALAIDGAQLGVWHWHFAETRLEWSDTCKAYFGLPLDTQMSFDKWAGTLHPADRQRIADVTTRAIETRSVFNEDYRVIWPDGTTHWINSMARVFCTPDGTPVRMEGVVIDISERKANEARLREAEEKLELAMQAGRLGVWDWDIAAGKLDWSDQCLTWFGLPAGTQASYDRFLDGLHPDDRQRVDQETSRAITERAEYEQDYRTRWPDGSVHWLHSMGRVFYAENGAPQRMLGVVYDITQVKLHEEALAAEKQRTQLLNVQLALRAVDAETATRAKDAFLRNVSHEFRTPLNHIIGGAEILQMKLSDPGQQKWIDMVLKSSRHLSSLVAGVLDLTIRESGDTLRRDEFSPGQLLQHVKLLLEGAAEAKGLSLVVCDAEDMPATLVGDPDRIIQSLLNYLGNAIKFNDHGTVTIAARLASRNAEGSIVRFEVHDSGAVIAAGERDKLFVPFEMGDASMTRTTGGLGVGLAQTRNLARTMGGDAGYEAPAGGGNTFWFTARFLPVVGQPHA